MSEAPRLPPHAAASELRRRLISAAVLAPVALLLVALGGWPFLALVLLAGALMLHEWARLIGQHDGPMLAVLAAGVLGAIVLAALGPADRALLWSVVWTLLWAVAAGLLAAARGRSAGWPALGLIYLALPCAVLIWLRALPGEGLWLVLWVLLLVWACDSGAYFAGRAIGGPRLAPRISPKKTWAGLFGGMIAAALVGIAFGAFGRIASPLALGLVSAGLAVIGQIGDLLESAVKRVWRVKDAGGLIPGHGGMLDRVDALLLVVPVAAALVLFGKGVGG